MNEVNNDMIRAVLQILRAVKPDIPAPVDAAVQSGSQQPPPTLFDKLAQGQQYPVTVLNPDIDGKALLRILGEKVLVETSMQLKQGQHLLVEVVSKNDVIQLQVKLSPTQAEIQAQYLKLVLPKQEPLSELLKMLNEFQLKLPDSGQLTNVQEKLQNLTRQLLASIPTTAELKDPQRFQKVLAESGIFLESRLSHSQAPARDLKSNLLRIAEQLRPQLIEAQQNTPAVTAYKAAKATLVTAKPDNPATQQPINTATGKPRETTAGQAAVTARPVVKEAVVSAHQANAHSQPRVNTSANEISQVKSVTEKTGMTATQAAQKAMMLGKSEPLRLLHSVTANLAKNTAIQHVLNLLPKTEIQVLIKQLLFKNTASTERNPVVAGTGQRLHQLAELLRSVESGLARIQTQQLASMPQDDATRQTWQLEIPFRDQKDMQAVMLRIEQDDKDANKDEAGSTWTVCLNFNIGQLGQIHSKIRLTAEVISTHFWAAEQETVEKISAHLPRLQQALEKLGLTVNHMTSSLGRPPDPVEITSIEERLLDENA